MRGVLALLVICYGCYSQEPVTTQYKEQVEAGSTSTIAIEQNSVSTAEQNNEADSQLLLAERGQEIFTSQCIACHDSANGGINILNFTAEDINGASSYDTHLNIQPWPEGDDALAVEAHLANN